MSSIDDIKKALKEEKLVMGSSRVLKLLKLGKLSKVYLTSNTPSGVKEDVEKYSSLAKIEVVNLKIANDALGTVCKKPFSVSVLGVK